MPIDEEGFENAVAYRNKNNYLMDFLFEKYPLAFSIQEMMEKFKKSNGAIYLSLMRMSKSSKIERKFIGKKAYYKLKEEAFKEMKLKNESMQEVRD